MAALQDWSVVWRFAYSHNRNSLFAPATAGYFDLASDPLNQAAERASLCLFLRKDMLPAPHRIGIALEEARLRAEPAPHTVAPPWNALALVTGVGTSIGGAGERVPADMVLRLRQAGLEQGAQPPDPDPYDSRTAEELLSAMRQEGWLTEGNRTDLSQRRLESETGELLVDAPRDTLVLSTSATAGAYAPAASSVQAGDVTVSIHETDATVWVSSLDGQPIAASERLLITHLTDLQNTEAQFAERARQTLLSWGRLPHLVRAGTATVRIAREGAGDVEVWALSTSGRRKARVDAQWEGKTLIVPLSVASAQGANLLYEISFAR